MTTPSAHHQLDRPTNSTTGRPIDNSPRGARRLAPRLAPRLAAAGVAAAVGLVVQFGGPSDSDARDRPADATPRLVEVAAVRSAPAHREARFSGLVRARQRGRLGFTLSGRLARRPAQIGARVDKGALLAELDTTPLRHARRAAQARLSDVDAQLAQLERDVQRSERLFAKKAGVRESVEKATAARDAVTARREALAAQLAEAERLLREARLTAPFAGTVLDVLLEPGETASPGAPIVVLSAEDQLEVEVEVPESIRAHLDTETPVQVDLPLAGLASVEGRVRQLGRAAAGAGALFPVVVGLGEAPAGVVPGFTADVRLKVERRAGQLVPVPAVSDPGGRSPFVYRLKDGLAERVPVEVLELGEDGVVVQSELHAGDEVVVRGHASLLPGEAVRVRR